MTIIKVAGRAKIANLDGRTIERPDSIFVKGDGGWFQTMDTYAHFVYKQDWKFGSTLLCTCGGVGGLFTYEAYEKFQSTNMGKIACCISLVETGKHADGSTE